MSVIGGGEGGIPLTGDLQKQILSLIKHSSKLNDKMKLMLDGDQITAIDNNLHYVSNSTSEKSLFGDYLNFEPRTLFIVSSSLVLSLFGNDLCLN